MELLKTFLRLTAATRAMVPRWMTRQMIPHPRPRQDRAKGGVRRVGRRGIRMGGRSIRQWRSR
eukprot:18840-Eustigmatos_ZCMA.PRE.1